MQQFLSEKGLARQYWPERLEVLPDAAVDGERQDPEIPAPRSDHGCVMTVDLTGNQAFLVAGVRTPFGRYGGAIGRPSARTTWPPTCCGR